MIGTCFQPWSLLKDGTSQSGVIQSKNGTKIGLIALNFGQSVLQLIAYKNHMKHWSYFLSNTVRNNFPSNFFKGLTVSVNISSPRTFELVVRYLKKRTKLEFSSQILLVWSCSLPDHEIKQPFWFGNLTLAQNYMEKLYTDPLLLHTAALIYLICRDLCGTCPFVSSISSHITLPQV